MAAIQTLPKGDMDSFARWVVKATIAYFDDPDTKRRFEEWKKGRELNAHDKTGGQKNE